MPQIKSGSLQSKKIKTFKNTLFVEYIGYNPKQKLNFQLWAFRFLSDIHSTVKL